MKTMMRHAGETANANTPDGDIISNLIARATRDGETSEQMLMRVLDREVRAVEAARNAERAGLEIREFPEGLPCEETFHVELRLSIYERLRLGYQRRNSTRSIESWLRSCPKESSLVTGKNLTEEDEQNIFNAYQSIVHADKDGRAVMTTAPAFIAIPQS